MLPLRDLIASEIPHLRRYARALLGDPDRADDLVQDCLLRAISRAHQWREGSNLRAWLFTILHSVFINDLRRNDRRPSVVSLDGSEMHIASLPAQDDSVELSQVALALQALPHDHRMTLLLVSLEGLTYDEVATITGVPVGTVRSRLFRARRMMRELMSPKEIQPVPEPVNS